MMETNLSDSDSDIDERPSFQGHSSNKSNKRSAKNDYYSNEEQFNPKRPRLDERSSFGSHSTSISHDLSLDNDFSESDEAFESKRPKFKDSSSTYQNNSKEKYDSEDEHQNNKNKKLSNVALGIMQRMGFSEGKGLGKYEQGRVEPVQAFNQKGRRGLGHDNKKLSEAKLRWDPNAEVLSVQEEISWIENVGESPTAEDMEDWMIRGPRKETIDDETLFCDPNILAQVVNSKSIFDTLDKHEMRRARTRSNPYETIRGAFFLNRAAVKMANMDKACDFMFTQPRSLRNNELLYFADVCAGPGGFSEYVLWRRKWHAKGFGFTLRDTNDFKLDDFYAGPPETFHPFYGPREDGNVYDPRNQNAFRQMIMEHTKGEGVHFMMSDGGFSVEGKENIQEILSKQLYLCQCLVALMIVRKGGHFVTKVFDLFTPFSAGLVYLMYKCFRKISIFKPNTSRPANSERYLICEEKLANIDHIIEYLVKTNEFLLQDSKELDVIELVPLEILQDDETFYHYLVDSNNSLGSKQIVGLLKIAAYCEDTTLFENRQAQMRKECLEYWNLPDQSRIVPRVSKPEDKLQLIVGSSILKILRNPSIILNLDNVQNTIVNTACDWSFVLSEGKNATFYLGMGRTRVFKLVKDSWERATNIELPPDTFVYAEIVDELRGKHKTLRKTSALHIIDAYFLGGEDISQKPLTERYTLISKFCEALWKPEYKDYHPVRAKELHTLDKDLKSKLILHSCTLKNGKKSSAYYPDQSSYAQSGSGDREPLFFIPNTVMFLKTTRAPWSRHISKTTGYHYYFHPKTNERFFDNDRPNSACATFAETFANRVEWHWLQEEQSLSLEYLYENVKKKCPDISPQH